MTDDAETAGSDLEKPPFRGCVFCYGAEMAVYGMRKLGSNVRGGDPGGE